MYNDLENKYFKTSIIATIIENYVWGDFNFDDFYEFVDFILGIKIKPGYLYDYKKQIINKIFLQYPELKNITRVDPELGKAINDSIMENRYLKKYGEYMIFSGKTPKVSIIEKYTKKLKRKYR